jgi:hypothetical protein
MKGTGADCFTFDSVPFDQREYEIRRLGERCIEPHTGISSEDLFDLVGRHPKSRIDQADIPSRSAMADRLGFKQPYFRILFGGVQRRGTTGKAAAYHNQVCRNIIA